MNEMIKTILITLDEDIPDYALGEVAIISIGETSFSGKVVGIVVHKEPTSITIEGQGLQIKPVKP